MTMATLEYKKCYFRVTKTIISFQVMGTRFHIAQGYGYIWQSNFVFWTIMTLILELIVEELSKYWQFHNKALLF